MIQPIFYGEFRGGGIFHRLFLRVVERPTSYLGGNGATINGLACMLFGGFRHIAPFPNHSVSKASGVKKRSQI